MGAALISGCLDKMIGAGLISVLISGCLAWVTSDSLISG